MNEKDIKAVAFDGIYEAMEAWGRNEGAERDFVSYCDGILVMAQAMMPPKLKEASF